MKCAISVLYNPNKNELNNILSYAKYVELIIIIDNSKENNFKSIEQIILKNGIKSKLEFVSHPENIGLCKALNEGIEIAKAYNCEWTLLMDADSSLQNNLINIYESYLEKNNDKSIATLSPVHIFDRSKNKKYQGTKLKKWAMTSGCYYNIEIFKKLGGFKEELFIDGVDMDYGYKAYKSGYKTIEIGEAILNHHPADTHSIKLFGKEIFKYGYASPYRYYLQAKSLIWVAFKYKAYEQLGTYIYKWLKVLFLFDNKKEYIKQIHKGTKEGFRLLKE